MPVLAKFRNLDLPVYPPDIEVLRHTEQYRKAVDEGVTSFLRIAGVEPPSGVDSLSDLLRTTDEHLSLAAQYCGASVVGHEWGLINNKKAKIPAIVPGISRGVLPKNHLLIARVDVVQQTRTHGRLLLPNDCVDKVIQGTQTYKEHHDKSGVCLRDIVPRQFMFGFSRADISASANSKVWLIDIEPRFMM